MAKVTIGKLLHHDDVLGILCELTERQKDITHLVVMFSTEQEPGVNCYRFCASPERIVFACETMKKLALERGIDERTESRSPEEEA